MVHMLENMDAKLMMSLSVTRGEKALGEGNWTEYQKAFGGKLYRPDVAMADMADQSGGDGMPVESRPVETRMENMTAAPRPMTPAPVQPMAQQPRPIIASAQAQKPAPAAVKSGELSNPLFELSPGKKK